jgi:hypothetical protein
MPHSGAHGRSATFFEESSFRLNSIFESLGRSRLDAANDVLWGQLARRSFLQGTTPHIKGVRRHASRFYGQLAAFSQYSTTRNQLSRVFESTGQ